MIREKTTDFNAWLDEAGVDTAEEMSCVYRTVRGERDYSYELISINGGNFLLRSASSDVDLFLTPRSKEAFLRFADSLYELGVEGQAAFEHAMSKED